MSQQPPGTDPPRSRGHPRPNPDSTLPPPARPTTKREGAVGEAPADRLPSAAGGRSVVPALPGAGGTGPTVLWATPTEPVRQEMPGAPGLSFADTTSRLVA